MPTFHPKADHRGEGVKLVGSPEDLIDLVVKDPIDRELVNNWIVNEGPKHKQVLSALLLQRLHRLVKVLESSTGTPFAVQEGYDLVKEHNGTDLTLPVALPINLGSDIEKHQIAEVIATAPEDESMAFALTLQVVEWAITAATQKHHLAV